MGYVNTIAHHTASAARSAGDPVFIRAANTDVGELSDLGVDVSAIATIATTVAELGKAAYDVKSSNDAAKAAKNQANDAAKAAATQAKALLAEQKRTNDAQIAAVNAKTSIVSKATPILLYSLGGAAVLGGAFFLVRLLRKRR